MSVAARVCVQVYNRSRAPAAGHPPALNKSSGNNFAFWKQFVAGLEARPSSPSFPWEVRGKPSGLRRLSRESMRNTRKSRPGSGQCPPCDKGPSCIVAFVHSADAPLVESAYDVDTVTRNNRQVAQKNLGGGIL